MQLEAIAEAPQETAESELWLRVLPPESSPLGASEPRLSKDSLHLERL
jgi:hypothetical protein